MLKSMLTTITVTFVLVACAPTESDDQGTSGGGTAGSGSSYSPLSQTDSAEDWKQRGWKTKGTWKEIDGMAVNDVDSTGITALYHGNMPEDFELQFSYNNQGAASAIASNYMVVETRNVEQGTRLQVYFNQKRAYIQLQESGETFVLARNNFEKSHPNTLYNVRVTVNGDAIRVYRAEDGGIKKEIMSYQGDQVKRFDNNRIYLWVRSEAQFAIDGIKIKQ